MAGLDCHFVNRHGGDEYQKEGCLVCKLAYRLTKNNYAMMVYMALLEIFLHPGCLSEDAALTLARELQSVWSALDVKIWSLPEASERAQTLGVIVAPAFVLNGKIIAVGVPRKAWLVAKLQEFGIKAGGLSP